MMKKFWKNFAQDFINFEITQVGAQHAFYLILAIFPFLIFLLNVLSFTSLGSLTFIEDIFQLVPDETSQLVKPVILDIVLNKSTTLLSLSLLLTLWSGSTGINSLLHGIRKMFQVNSKDISIIKQRIYSVFYLLLFVLIIILLLVTQVFGDKIFELILSFIGDYKWLRNIYKFITTMIPFLLMVIVFSILYYTNSASKRKARIDFTTALYGGLITTFGLLFISFGFNYYVNHFASYAKTYGSLGGFIVLMIWLWLTSIVILIGALCAKNIYLIHNPTTQQTN